MKSFRPWMTMPVYVCAIVTWIFFEYTVYAHPAMGFTYNLLGAIGEVFLGGFVIRDSVIHIVTLWQSLSPVTPPPATSLAPVIRATRKPKFSSLRTGSTMHIGVLCDIREMVDSNLMQIVIFAEHKMIRGQKAYCYWISFRYGIPTSPTVSERADFIHFYPIVDIDMLCSALVWDASRVAGRVYNHLPRNRADVIYAEAKRLIDAL